MRPLNNTKITAVNVYDCFIRHICKFYIAGFKLTSQYFYYRIFCSFTKHQTSSSNQLQAFKPFKEIFPCRKHALKVILTTFFPILLQRTEEQLQVFFRQPPP